MSFALTICRAALDCLGALALAAIIVAGIVVWALRGSGFKYSR